jgi:NADP-dependent 3-hydroxy acid dehydrogenase YdfG
MRAQKTVVITGASSGIGAALAARLGADGHRLVLAARREAELRAVAGRASSPANVIVVPADVTRRADVDRVRDRALASFDHVDVWVNNAGRGISRAALDVTDEDFDAMMAVNVKSALYGMQAIVPHFKTQGAGHLINVSSVLSRVPFATFRSAYNAAKHALNALTANARVDLAATHPGIHVTLVMPGLVATDFPHNALGGSPPILQRPGMPAAQSADDVAASILHVIEEPVAEIYTNPEHAAVVQRYFQDVGAFERQAAAGR